MDLDTGNIAADPVGTPFPAALLGWAGHRSGGVRRLFDDASGRPGEEVFRTNLLHRLRSWAERLAEEAPDTPRILLLVGGPGNGKTEAIEATIQHLDQGLGCQGALVAELATSFRPPAGVAVPRLAQLDAGELAHPARSLRVEVVQDASVGKPGPGGSPAELLVKELSEASLSPGTVAYLCCVNRGVLDDALIHAIDMGLAAEQRLLEAITRAVSLTPDAPSCWPLDGHAHVAAWPMDVESLIEPTEQGDEAPVEAILRKALDPSRWPAAGKCAAGELCPFCTSRKLLSTKREKEALCRILRWYELGSGKRWTFRDLFSVVSFLLAGNPPRQGRAAADPCGWAGRLLNEEALPGTRRKKGGSAALFHLVAAQYQHALFHRWPHGAAASLAQDIKEVGLGDDKVAAGLREFLASRGTGNMPAPIASLLDGVGDLLDPALASPEIEVTIGRSAVPFGELDARFSRSTREGLDYADSFLSSLERQLLSALAELDERLASPQFRRKRPAAATRIQRIVRDFCCRLARRSIGTRTAAVPDAAILDAFAKVIADADGPGYDLQEAAAQVERLLNSDRYFEVSLTTTFGQPTPPLRQRAILQAQELRVRPRESIVAGRPRSAICFLDVPVGGGTQAIALTYDLFKALKELERGLSPASLPRSVLALLDTIRARLAGYIVRDREARERPSIILGQAILVERHRGRFATSKRGVRR